MATIFTRIVKGEIPCYKIMENERFLAFLDIRPINPGHTLVIVKEEIDYLFDVEDVLLGEMMVFCKKVARLIRQKIPCKRIGVMVAGLEVPHAHIHLVPMINNLGELNFDKAQPAAPDELKRVAELITG